MMLLQDRYRLEITIAVVVLVALALGSDKALGQQTVPHRESCTKWGPVRGQYGYPYFGTVNSCSEPVTVQLLIPGFPEIIRRDLKPMEVFNTGFSLIEAPDIYVFTTCPAGYVSSVPLVPANSETLRRSQYTCVME